MGIPAPFGVSSSGLSPQGDLANGVVTGPITKVGPKRPFAFRGPMNLELWASFATALTTTANSLAASVAAAGAIAIGAAINSVNVPPGTTWATFSGTSGTLALPTVCYYASGLSLANASVTLPAGSNVKKLLGATVTTASNAEGITLPANTTVAGITQADVAPSNVSPGLPGIIQLSAIPTAVPNLSAPQPLDFGLAAAAITVSGADANASFTGAAIVYTGTLQIERSFDGAATWLVCNIGGAGALAQYTSGTPVSLTFGEPEKQVLYRVNCTAWTTVDGVSGNYRISQTGGAAESLAIGPLSGG